MSTLVLDLRTERVLFEDAAVAASGTPHQHHKDLFLLYVWHSWSTRSLPISPRPVSDPPLTHISAGKREGFDFCYAMTYYAVYSQSIFFIYSFIFLSYILQKLQEVRSTGVVINWLYSDRGVNCCQVWTRRVPESGAGECALLLGGVFGAFDGISDLSVLSFA